MKILLINPGLIDKNERDLYDTEVLIRLSKGFNKGFSSLPLALPTIAALTPPEIDVKIIDDQIEDINFEEKADLVALTAMTYKATRAYQIAAEYKKRGIITVMGGIHASLSPQEAIQHVNSVVIGEAENTWPELLKDFKAGKLKKFYKQTDYVDLTKSPSPRRDLIKKGPYLNNYIQTTRGCPFNCDFCTVQKFNGRKLRKKSPDQVIKELEDIINSPKADFAMIKKSKSKKRVPLVPLFITDDNFAIDKKHAHAICDALIEFMNTRKVEFFWGVQVNFMTYKDEELLRKMYKAGCRGLLIGFESVSGESLAGVRKRFNKPDEYSKGIKIIRKFGMDVDFSVIFGMDTDKIETIEETKKFIFNNNMFLVLLNILTPYPGTDLGRRIKEEQRVFHQNWDKYNVKNVVFTPSQIKPVELQEKVMQLYESVFTINKENIKRMQHGLSLVDRGDKFILPHRAVVIFNTIKGIIEMFLKKELSFSEVLLLFKEARKQIFSSTLWSTTYLLYLIDYNNYIKKERKRVNRYLEKLKKYSKRDFCLTEKQEVLA